MKNNRRGLVETGIFLFCALLIGVLGTFAIYRLFPQYLCYTVQNVHASELYDRQDLELSKAVRYMEYFTPTGDYIKSIFINLRGNTQNDETRVSGTLLEEGGNVIARSNFEVGDIQDSAFREFSIEKWVNAGQVYQFVVDFPADADVSVTFGPEDIGPEEHVSGELDGRNDEGVMYMQYSYGSYSRKLLAFWFLVFTVSAYLIGDCFLFKKK
ncbi:MAG: hypothetical protein J1E64_05600 [Acetatifactor sp.]|nr:hypothetical protein [Acetatifactor sp.]